ETIRPGRPWLRPRASFQQRGFSPSQNLSCPIYAHFGVAPHKLRYIDFAFRLLRVFVLSCLRDCLWHAHVELLCVCISSPCWPKTGCCAYVRSARFAIQNCWK